MDEDVSKVDWRGRFRWISPILDGMKAAGQWEREASVGAGGGAVASSQSGHRKRRRAEQLLPDATAVPVQAGVRCREDEWGCVLASINHKSGPRWCTSNGVDQIKERLWVTCASPVGFLARPRGHF